MAAVVAQVMCKDREEALAIARRLVDERLVACGNVLAGAVSVYRWEGAVHEEGEALLVLKTRAELADRVTARVRELHSYACPCIVFLPVATGNPDYLAWIEAQASA